MAGTKRRASSMELFRKFNILPLANEFLFSLSSFIVDNMEQFHPIQDTDWWRRSYNE
jgi:hypothetical protein